MRRGLVARVAAMLPGGRAELMRLAEHAPEVDARVAPIVEDWRRLPLRGRMAVDLDVLCLRHGVTAVHFLGVVTEAALAFRDTAGPLIAALAMPEVMRATIDRALTPEGAAEKKMLMQHAGYLPTPQGPKVAFINSNQNTVQQPAKVGLASFEQDVIDAEVAGGRG